MRTAKPFRYVWTDAVAAAVRAGVLTSRANNVAMTMAVRYANGRTNGLVEAWPSIPELAEVTGESERTVKSAIRELVDAGFLDVRRGKPASTSGNVYRLRIGPPEASEPS